MRASDSQIAGAQADPEDNDLHGSHVAGLVAAATDNGAGVSGAGFDTALMAAKVTLSVPAGAGGNSRFVANVVDALTWATDNGARVINMSFGTGTFHPALAAAVAYAVAHDVLPVAAAGNTQEDPAARGVPLYPAALPGVLAVGATDSSGAITSFSTNGSYVDVAAPGDRILSTWDTRAPGILAGPGRIAGYQVLRGTSMASPIVAGLAGLIRDLRPDLAEAQVESIIEGTAIDRGAPGRDPAYGAGDIDAGAAMRAAAAAAAAGPPPSQPAARPAPARLAARSRIAYTLHRRPAAGADRPAPGRGARRAAGLPRARRPGAGGRPDPGAAPARRRLDGHRRDHDDGPRARPLLGAPGDAGLLGRAGHRAADRDPCVRERRRHPARGRPAAAPSRAAGGSPFGELSRADGPS